MKILIDLSKLKTPNCGLGQVALNYGYYYRDEYIPCPDEQIYLLVPKQFVGVFGGKVKYIVTRNIYRIFPCLIGIHFDVWHTTFQLSPYRPFAKHVIYTIHDFNPIHKGGIIKGKRFIHTIQREINRADIVVCISQFTLHETERFIHLGQKKPIVVYTGIERIETHPETIPINVDPNKSFLFTIGEVLIKKNFHVLLTMMEYLPQYQLYIAGKDTTSYTQQIREQIHTKNLSNVHLLGMVTDAEKVWLYHHCSAFLFPSLFEGWGSPILEAMLFKKPVICSHETALVESGGQYVTFFPKDFDAKQSATIINTVIQTTTSSQLEDAYRYATSFSWNKHLSSYLNLYRSYTPPKEVKKILIDLYTLRQLNSGLGQVALNYGFYFRDKYNPLPNEQIYLLVPKEYINTFGDKVKYIRVHTLYHIFPWLIGIKFDVWHTIFHDSNFRPFTKKTIFTIHDFNYLYRHNTGFKKQRFLRTLQHRIDNATVICCISQFTRGEIERYLDVHNKPVQVIYTGIERIDLCTPQEQCSLKIQEPYLLFVGQVIKTKNVHVLLDMMTFLPQYQLYIAGNDTFEYAHSIRHQIVEKGLTNVHLLGVVSPTDKVWLYTHCSAFVFPSLFEGWGSPVLEAMLFKKPVICAHTTTMIETGGGNVTFFPDTFQPEVSAQTIDQTITHTTTEQLNKAYEYAISFSWEKHLETYLQLYRHLATL